MDTFRDKRRQDELLKVAEQAAEWLIALDEGQPEERAAFAQWLEESPLHVKMFLRATAVDRMGDFLAPEDRKRLVESLGADEGSNVVALEAPPSASRSSGRRGVGASRRWFGGVAAAVAVVSAGAWWFVAGPGSWERFATAVGEQRAVALDDGSFVYVNTDTRIDVRYSRDARELRLVSGEALFKVEHDARRPFRVHVGDTVVRAVGTQFNIYRGPAGTRVAVIEGVVQVSKDKKESTLAPPSPAMSGEEKEARPPAVAGAKAAGSGERLAAGQGVHLAADGKIEQSVEVNVAQVTAWRQRRLIFEWETLATIADEFNRYNRSPQIRVDGEDVRGRRYTAVFDADNPQTLLKFLAKENGLEFAAEGSDLVIRGR